MREQLGKMGWEKAALWNTDLKSWWYLNFIDANRALKKKKQTMTALTLDSKHLL